jgi:phage baseplate assembly protein W
MANLVINLSTLSPNTYGNIYKDISSPLFNTFEANVDVNAVKQSIKNIFSWRKGQRILNPAFGNIIYDYVYEPINDVTIKNLRAGILQMLSTETRINVIALTISPVEDENTIYVSLQYIIPALNIVDSFDINVNVMSV